MKRSFWVLHAVVLAFVFSNQSVLRAQEPAPAPEKGSVIFIHPDGAGVSAWAAARLLTVGPDGILNWDRLDHMGLYRGHMKNSMGATSHGGGTSHAFGVKVHWDSYGMDGTEPLTSLSGKPHSILVEAQEAGFATALVNTGHLAEPGTGVFAASAPARSAVDEITKQIIEGGTDIILSGGEILLLPQGVQGKFFFPGIRRDSLNLIERAEELGYAVVYSRDELMALPPDTEKVLGVFAAAHTFSDRSEEVLQERELSLYAHWAPSVAEMTEAALGFLKASGRPFLLVVEEEGSDNFANQNNALGSLTALARADEAFGVALDFVEANPETLLITTADSDAGGLEVYPIRDADPLVAEKPLPVTTRNGGALDGRNGTGTPPFMSKPDQFGETWPFGIAWASFDDNLGGMVAKAHGLNAHLLPKNVDNTDIYRMMYATLFGVWFR
ncbi:MAG: alkaline phosphatase [Gemmatimonadetes bacterium]|nr:alkaline phosphatase [Gemmatimonadota bacterium]NNM03606.1 alkaline phosphatase [Gemmatimonadota bacterium]